MPVTIASIRQEHIEGYHAALDAVARERRYLTFLDAPPLDAARRFVSYNMAAGYPHFVALHGDRVVGWCDVTPQDRPATRHRGLLGMGLLGEWRGRGVGRRLIQRAIEASRALPLARVELTVRADNESAIALYRRVGFEEEGRRRRALLVDAVYYDDILMALLLDAAP
jgi:ribosomal protein S18 acetylase RimI-like enzyme